VVVAASARLLTTQIGLRGRARCYIMRVEVHGNNVRSSNFPSIEISGQVSELRSSRSAGSKVRTSEGAADEHYRGNHCRLGPLRISDLLAGSESRFD
jgi:hypothetical protein